ncbi:hypothetical protein ACQJBY_005616 [Aegilops geniculata]
MSMVLDEVESAGAHSQDCLPHSGSPGRSAAGGGGGGSKDSWACELLRRGWGLTRTAAIAGAAATAAPVVAPPLLVLSAAGVALSVPFAAYLASLAAANHLTGALLRSCQPPPQPCPQEYDDLEQEFLDASEGYGQEARVFGHFDAETEQGIVGEEDGSDTSLPLSRDPGELADDEVEGEFSAQEFSAPSKPLLQEDDTLVQKREDEFSAPSKPLLQEEDTLVQTRGEDEFSVLNSDQHSLQSNNWKGKEDVLCSKSNEEDDRTMEENRPAKETVSQGFYFPELGVPASGGDDDNVVQEKGEDEFSVQNSGQQPFQFLSKNLGEKEVEDGEIMEENKPTKETVSQVAPAFGYLDTETYESDTLPLLPRDPGVSKSSAPAFADDEVEEEVQGEFSAQESGHGSYISNRSNDTEEHTPFEGRESTGKETLPRGFGVSASANPLFPEEDNVVQEKGNDEEAEQVSGKQLFQSKNWNETEDAMYSQEEGDGKTMEENKNMNETVSQSLCFPESHVPASGEDDDNVVQDKGESRFDAQNSGQQPFQPKNLNEKVEEDGKTTEENKSTKEMLFYESSVPASGDEDNVVQEKREGEFSVQNLGQLPFQSKIWNEKEEDDKTTEENKSTKVTHSQGSYFPESTVPASGDEDKKGEDEFSVHNLGKHSLLSDIVDKKEHGITMDKKKSTEDMPPAPVFHGEDNVVQSKEGFEVTMEGVLEEANSNTDLVMDEVVDAQVEIIVTAAPESEVLPPSTDLVMAEVVDVQVEIIAAAALDSEEMSPSNLVAPELHPDIVTGEVNDVYVGMVAAVEPESEVLHESNLAIGASTTDPGTGEISDVQVNTVAAAKPEDEVLRESDLAACASTADLGIGEISDVQVNIVAAAVRPEDEVLPLSNLTECESQVVVETAHVGDIVGISATGHNVKDSGDVDKQGMECCFVPVASMHDTEDVISSGSTPYFSTMGEEIIDLSDQSSDVGYTARNEAFRRRVATESEARYTEEQLREQLDTIRTITGYGAVPSSTLEGELAGLYIFVGVEAPVGSSDTSDRLMALSAELRFLKSIIGVD